jgi:hypothetical protein
LRKRLLAICLVSASESSFPPQLTLPAAGWSAWMKTGKSWFQVPAQVDERDHNGDYVLEHGLPFTAGGGDGLFNNRDELVLDFPEEAREAVAISDGVATGWLKQRGISPGNANRVLVTAGARKFELLFVRDGKSGSLPPAAPFDPKTKTIDAGGYRYRFNQQNPAAIGQLQIPDASGNGFTTINEDGGFAVWLTPPWGFPIIKRSNADIEGAVESWRTGPVRAIVAVGGKYTAFWSLVKAHLFSELVFYRNRFQIPSVVDIPFSPGKMLGQGSGFAYGLRMEGNAIPRIEEAGKVSVIHSSGLVLSASVDPELARAGTLPQVWRKGQKPDGARVPGHVAKWFEGTGVTIGFFVDISRMRHGRYDFSLDLESRGKANQTHTDFLTCKSVWTPMAPTQTSRPVTKQE